MPVTSDLPYLINDADNHFTEPHDCFERYIDPSKRALAIRAVTTPDGEDIQVFAGRPSKFHSKQVTFSGDELARMLGDTSNLAVGRRTDGEHATGPTTVPGMFLNRLNPLKGLSDAERETLVGEFRQQSEAFGNRELRLALMSDQGIDKAIMYPDAAHAIEFELADHVDALYANIRAFNRWIDEEVGFVVQGRMFVPPYLSLADVDLAVQELEIVLSLGTPMIQLKSGNAHGGRNHPFGGRSVADPYYDPFWERVNEAGVRVAVHLGGTDYQKHGADWSEDPDAVFGDFDAFQWMMYWGDRPAMELTAGLILHNFFGRFPNLRVCLAEQGTVWLPYTLRKLDHAFLLGRKARWATEGRLDKRPSQIFREHFIVAPFPEENVERVIAEVGMDALVFGSDFPHGEGLAYPSKYVSAQLSGLSEPDQRRIMRDTLEDFLTI